MLEGNEVDVNLGSVGHATLDIDGKGNLSVGLSAKINLVDELKKLAEKTSTPIDDAAIAWVEKLLALGQ